MELLCAACEDILKFFIHQEVITRHWVNFDYKEKSENVR